MRLLNDFELSSLSAHEKSEYARALAVAEEALDCREMERDLGAFMRGVWPILWPNEELEWLPYLEVICSWLMALRRGEILRLIINQPPQTLKSTVVSIIFPCWLWATEPHTRIICSTYGQEKLSIPQSLERRRLLTSEWYEARWPTRIMADSNQRWRYLSDDGGHITATSTGSGITGTPAHYILIDDPHNVEESLSDAQREAGVRFIRQSLMTRFSDPPTGRAVLVMHRLHEADATGDREAAGWLKISLSARPDEDEDIPLPGGEVWRRPRGDLLAPRRLSEAVLADKLTDLGSRGFSAQYQQKPSPKGGIIFKPEWWRSYKAGSVGFDFTAISVDAAFKESTDSDFVSIQAWGFTGPRSYLIEKDTERRGFVGTKHAIRAMAERLHLPVLLIEDTANGPAIIEELKKDFSVIPVPPKGGKVARAEACSPDVEAGNVYLPDEPWASSLIDLLAKFPAVAYDDDVDALTQALNWRRQRAWGILESLKKEASLVPKPQTMDNPMAWRE